MKIITMNTVKGGVGKTTLTYQFGEYLASLGKKVLLLDFDFQRNLTELYLPKEEMETEKGSVKNIFLNTQIEVSNEEEQTVNDTVTVHHIKDNLDLVAGSANFDEVKSKLNTNPAKNQLFYYWLNDMENLGKLDYDYIIIDTRPEFDFIVGNAVIASDAIISPITPDIFGVNSRFDELAFLQVFKQQNVDLKTRKTIVDARLLLIANKVEQKTILSKKLSKEIEDNNIEVIEKIPERELFNRSTQMKIPLVEMRKNKKYSRYFNFIDEMNKKWGNIKEQIDNL